MSWRTTVIMSSRKLRASLTPSPASKSQSGRRYPSFTPTPVFHNQKRKLTTQKKIIKSQSDNGLSSTFRNLSLTPQPKPPERSRSISPRKPKSESTLSTLSVSSIVDIANLIKEEKCKNIIIMAGAGISTPSGIPDFRTPGTGLYDNLKEYNIPEPSAIFDIEYFWYDPRPFFCLAKSLYPGNFQPNYVHYFINLLSDKGLLLRMYTQNIDGLELLAGLPKEKLVEAHGTFSSASCIKCHKKYDGDKIKQVILKGDIPRCSAAKCKGVIKPDIVFFGEDLPKKFYSFQKDFPKCDLLIVMGTSLEVQPFAGIVSEVSRLTPRLLINREEVGPFASAWRGRRNDVFLKGDVITGVKRLVKLLDWTDVMNNIVDVENRKWKGKGEGDVHREDGVDREDPDSKGPPKLMNGNTKENSRKYHTLVEKVPNHDTSNNTKNAALDLTTEESVFQERSFEIHVKSKPVESSNGTKTHRLLNSVGTRVDLPETDKALNQDSSDVNDSKNGTRKAGPDPKKDSLFGCNSVIRRMPLLPFRYTHRAIPEPCISSYRYIDPSRDLASAGFGVVGRNRKKCYTSSSDSDTSSNDNSSGG